MSRQKGDREAVRIEVRNAAAAARSALAGAGTGTGWRGLREHVGAHGGRVAAGATTDGGWRLHAVLPRPAGVAARARAGG